MGRGAPFPTDHILVVLSVTKDLRFIPPQKNGKNSFGWSWRRGFIPPPLKEEIPRKFGSG